MTSEYAMYVVPDTPGVLGPFESISFNINWRGPHITICRFTAGNVVKIPYILDYIRSEVNPLLAKQSVLWNPLLDKVSVVPNMYIFESTTLTKLTTFLKNYVELVKENDFHIYNRLRINPDIFALGLTKWSMIMIKKTGDKIEWLTSTRVPLYKID
jgi:hypothetical protein